jgi:hypothetical protein
MSEPTDMMDAEIAEMLGFYRGAAMRVDQQQAAGSAPQQTEETEYVPRRSQRPPPCEPRASIGRILDRGRRGLAKRIERRHTAR